MPAIATGVVIGGAIVGGGAVGAIAGAHLKKPIEKLFKTPSSAPQNYPGSNSLFNEIKVSPLGSGRAPTVAELLQEAKNLDIARRGSWENWGQDGR